MKDARVNDIIGECISCICAAWPIGSLVVAVVGGIAAGAISAMRPNGIIDYAITFVIHIRYFCSYLYYWCSSSICGRF